MCFVFLCMHVFGVKCVGGRGGYSSNTKLPVRAAWLVHVFFIANINMTVLVCHCNFSCFLVTLFNSHHMHQAM